MATSNFSQPRKRPLFQSDADEKTTEKHATRHLNIPGPDVIPVDFDFKVNGAYAAKYNQWRKNEELQKYKDRYGNTTVTGDEDDDDKDDDESSSSEESDAANAEFAAKEEIDFFRALSLVKGKDPRLYDKSFRAFSPNSSEESDGNDSDTTADGENSTSKPGPKNAVNKTHENLHADEPARSSKSNKKSKLTLADYEMKVALTRSGQMDDDDDDESGNINPNSSRILEDLDAGEIKTRFAYDAEQRDVKNAFLAAAADEQMAAAAGTSQQNRTTVNDFNNQTLLSRRVKTTEEERQEEESYRSWLKGKSEKVDSAKPNTRAVESDMKFLHDYWNDPSLDEGERFLRDFILNKRYLNSSSGHHDETHAGYTKRPKMQHEANAIPGPVATHRPEPRQFRPFDDTVKEDAADDDKEIAENQRLDEFEQKYNFRFEEPDAEFIKRYPRTIGDSMRKSTDTAGSTSQRESARERRQRMLQQRRDEIRQYKSLVKEDVVKKIEKLKEIAGSEKIDFSFEDLEADFDPSKYDKKMQELFGNDYYAEETSKTKKQQRGADHYNDDDDDGDGKPVFSDESDVEQDWDTYELNAAEKNAAATSSTNDDADAANTLNQKKKTKRLTNFTKQLQQPKQDSAAALAAYNASKTSGSGETFEEYLNRYYKLDCEDVIAGGEIACRFHYRPVKANSFGLTAEEILIAPERELNQWVSLKRVVARRDKYEDERDEKYFAEKAKSMFKKKKKKLPSLFKSENDDDDVNEEKDAVQQISTKHDKDKNGRKIAAVKNDDDDDAEHSSEKVTTADASELQVEPEMNDKNSGDDLPVAEAETSLTEAETDAVDESKPSSTKQAEKSGTPKKRRRQKKKKRNADTTSTAQATGASSGVIALVAASSPAVQNKTISKKQSKKFTVGKQKTGYQRHFRGSVGQRQQQQQQQFSSSSSKPKQSNEHRDHVVFKLSDERLKAYGLNPKKVRNRVQFGGDGVNAKN